VIAIGNEVTARKLADEVQARLAAIVDSSDDAIVSKTLDGVITSWNRGAEAIFGYTASEAVGRHISFIIPEERRPEEEGVLARLRRGEKVDHFETVRRAKDGRRIDISLTVSPIRAADGRIVGASKVARDIGDRKRVEEAQRARAEHFRKLAELVPQLVWTAAPDGTVDYFNRRWSEYTGTVAPQGLGDGWVHVVHSDERKTARECWQAAMRSGEPIEAEWRLRRADGQYEWFLVRGAPLRDTQGGIAKWFGTCTNINAQKRAEQALREADRTKDEFLAMLSHELRNPLGAISTAVRLVADAVKHDATAARAHAIIDRQVVHLARLVDDLLDVGRITAGKIVLDRRPLNLADVAAGVVNAWQTSGRLAHHRVSVEGTPTWVEADETRMVQVVTNLLGNAVKFTPTYGAVRVRVGVEGSQAVLEVQDSGMGMAPHLVGQVFSLFAQGAQPPDRSQGGLGVGLTLVRHLVERHGGTVSAHSDGPGSGSVFAVRLPRIDEPSRQAVTPPDPRAVLTARRILLIEDNEDAREMLQLVLEREGHTVVAAADGEEGIALAESASPELALIDIGLPRIDGYEVARRIRASAGSRLTLVALTGYGSAVDRTRARHAGFDAHLVKPVDPTKLAEVIAGRSPA
jgi:PAS domain S-box-containing protein